MLNKKLAPGSKGIRFPIPTPEGLEPVEIPTSTHLKGSTITHLEMEPQINVEIPICLMGKKKHGIITKHIMSHIERELHR